MPATTERPVRLVVQVGGRLTGDALAACLAGRPDVGVVGETASQDDLSALILRCRPDVAMIDAGELTVDLVTRLAGLHARFPAVRLVVAYTHLTTPALRAAVRAGLVHLVPCARGPVAIARTLREHLRGAMPAGSGQRALTERELQIILLLSTGGTVAEIAATLDISPRTVENHKRHLYAKLGVGSQSHAVSRATGLGLLEPVLDAEPRPRPGPEGERDPLVLVGGPAGATVDEVVRTLLRCRQSVVHARQRPPVSGDQGAGWPRGPSAGVLVDPGAEDWQLPTALAIPVVVVYSAEPDLATVADALLRGSCGVLCRDQVRSDLAVVLSVVGRGYFAMNAERLGQVTNCLRARTAEHPAEPPELTARESDILGSIARGDTVRQTARALGIAAKTVENTQAKLFRKLGARNRIGALTVGYRMGLIAAPARPPRSLSLLG